MDREEDLIYLNVPTHLQMEDLECVLCCRKWSEDKFPEGPIHTWGIVVDKNVFCYGLSGCYEITDPKIEVLSGRICNECLKDITYQEYFSVECDQCHQKFQGSNIDDGGWGCASTVYETEIHGYWGSKYDGDYIDFLPRRPDAIKIGSNLCDNCISKLLNDGVCYYQETEHISVPIPISTPPK